MTFEDSAVNSLILSGFNRDMGVSAFHHSLALENDMLIA